MHTVGSLARARVAQHACFIRQERRVVVWADKTSAFKETVRDFEAKLIDYVFNCTARRSQPSRSVTHASLNTQATVATQSHGSSPPRSTLYLGDGQSCSEKMVAAVQSGNSALNDRELPLNHSIYTGIAVSIDLLFCGLLIRAVVCDALISGKYIQLAILAVVPALVSVFLVLGRQTTNISCTSSSWCMRPHLGLHALELTRSSQAVFLGECPRHHPAARRAHWPDAAQQPSLLGHPSASSPPRRSAPCHNYDARLCVLLFCPPR